MYVQLRIITKTIRNIVYYKMWNEHYFN